MEKGDFAVSCLRLKKLLELRESLNSVMGWVTKNERHREKYLTLRNQLNETIAEEARFLDAASR